MTEDYQNGLPGCGIKTALQLARTGIGRNLIHAVRNLPIHEASTFSRGWAEAFKRQLRNSNATLLPPRYARLADNMPSDFPNITILRLYIHPLTSTTPDPVVRWSCPSLSEMARFAEDNFIWGHGPGILKHFMKMVFPGLALRQLIAITLQNDGHPNPFAALYPLIASRPIISQCRHWSTGSLAELRIAIPLPRQVIDQITSSLCGRYWTAQWDKEAEEWIKNCSDRVLAWVPLVVMEHAYPRRVRAFFAVPDPQGDGSEGESSFFSLSSADKQRPE